MTLIYSHGHLHRKKIRTFQELGSFDRVIVESQLHVLLSGQAQFESGCRRYVCLPETHLKGWIGKLGLDPAQGKANA